MEGDPWEKLHLWKKQYEGKYGSKQGMDFEGFYERPKVDSIPSLNEILSYNTIVSYAPQPSFEIPNAPHFSAYLRKMTKGKFLLEGPYTYPLDPFSFETGERWFVHHEGKKIGEYKCHGQMIDGLRGTVFHMEYSGRLPETLSHVLLRFSGKKRQDENEDIPFP